MVCPYLCTSDCRRIKDGVFNVPSGNLGPNVATFCGCAAVAIAILALRRKKCGGELGGPPVLKWVAHLPAYLSSCLPTCLPIYLSAHLPIYLSTYLPIYLSTYLVTIYLSTCLPSYPLTCLCMLHACRHAGLCT